MKPATACICIRRQKRWACRATNLIEALHTGKAKYSSIFNYPTKTWADIGVVGWLVDGAAIMNQIPLTRCSYGPYARAMIRVCKEESFHQRQGFDLLLTLMKRLRRTARDGAGRHQPLVVAVTDDVRPARQRFDQQRRFDEVGHQAHQQRRAAAEVRRRDRAAGALLGVTLPDPELKCDDATGHLDFGPIDWTEFWKVVNGNGRVQ